MNASLCRIALGAAVAFSLGMGLGCAKTRLVKTDPFFKTFFEKTSLLMTEEEIEFYGHLPDQEAKAAYIEDFWKIRDPDPATEENENRSEFERRVAFANEWFGVPGQARRKPAPTSLHRDRGWNTARGVAYIVLGPPDSISMSWSPSARDIIAFDDGYRLSVAAVWYYERFRMPLFFSSAAALNDPEADPVEETLRTPTMTLRTLSTNTEQMEQAKAEWIFRDHLRGLGEPLRFKARFREKGLDIIIPVKAVRFLENEDRSLTAAYQVDVLVYRNNRKVETLSARKTFAFGEKEAEALDRLEIRLPYDPPGRGRYVFEVVVRADDPSVLSRRRQVLKAKL